MKPNRPGREDVARLAGVSLTTVSLVMNNRGETVRLSLATRERVLNAAKVLNYNPNPLMQSVLRGRTNCISFWIPKDAWDSPNPYWMDLIRTIRDAASESGLDILLHHHRSDEDARTAVSRMCGGLVDGVVIVPAMEDVVAAGLASSHVRAIALDDPYPGLPCVRCDSASGMEMLAEHVLSRGHRSVAYFDRSGAPVFAAVERLAALRRTLAKQGVELPEHRILRLENPSLVEASQFLAMDPKPSVVFCFNEVRATALLRSCERSGIRVPEDLAITGFDGDGGAPTPNVRTITSFDVGKTTTSRLAIKLLCDLIDGGAVAAETLTQGKLVLGDTV